MSRGQSPASRIAMTELQQDILQEYSSKYTTGQQKAKRAKILLLASQGCSNSEVKRKVGVALNTVKAWRSRWISAKTSLAKFENYVEQGESSLTAYREEILQVLNDIPRSGAPKVITLSQEQQIIALACKKPSDYKVEMTDWTHKMLARVAISQGIVSTISSRQVGRILKK